MLTDIARWGVILSGVYLIAVSGLMAFAPGRAIGYIGKAGSTVFVNVAEHLVRMLAGIALVLASDTARYPAAFDVIGWFLIVSSGIILLIPRRWHAAYAVFWATRLPRWAVRVLSPVPLVAGGLLIYAVV